MKFKGKNRNKYSAFLCEDCGSNEVICEKGYYICQSCGLMICKAMVYNRPFKKDQIYHHRHRVGSSVYTKLGNQIERNTLKHSERFNRQAKLQLCSVDHIKTRILIEITRIFHALQLPNSYIQHVFEKTVSLRESLSKKTKFRAPSKLVPCITYYIMKINAISISEEKLLGVSRLSKKEFGKSKLLVQSHFSEYLHRERKKYILQKISQLQNNFQLPNKFYKLSCVILTKFWSTIKNTTDEIIAGIVSSIVVLSTFRSDISINSICSLLGISMSTIQTQIKRLIVDICHMKGFTSLVKSADLISKLVKSIELVEQKKESGIKTNNLLQARDLA